MSTTWRCAALVALAGCTEGPLPPQPLYGGPCARDGELFDCLDGAHCVSATDEMGDSTASICTVDCAQDDPLAPSPERQLNNDCPAAPAGFTGQLWCDRHCTLRCTSDGQCPADMRCADGYECLWPAPIREQPPPSQDLGAVEALSNGGVAAGLLRAATGWRLCRADEDCTDATPDCEPTVDDCLRDTYVCAAVTLAWAAASHAAIGDETNANAELDAMMANLCTADGLCSDAPPVGGQACITEDLYSCPGLSCPGG